MFTHLVLLRSVNVSGRNIVKMQILKEALLNNGFQNVKTYIQSGNIFVDKEEVDSYKIKDQIEKIILDVFGLTIIAIPVTLNDLKECIFQNPYQKKDEVDTKQLYVAFTSDHFIENADETLNLIQFMPDRGIIFHNKLFLLLVTGAGNTKLNQKYIEKKLGVDITIRNWNTINKLFAMYSE